MTQRQWNPETDELARNAARKALVDQVEMFVQRRGGGMTAEHIADWAIRHYAVTGERAVNIDPSASQNRGTPNDPNVYVRHAVLRGPWEIDPEGKPYHDRLARKARRWLGLPSEAKP